MFVYFDAVDATTARPLHGALMESLQVNADRIAVRAGSNYLTYRRLAERARQVAARVGDPIKPDGTQAVVAIMLPRGEDLITALLGVFLSGAAFLPVDPQLPLDRRSRLLAHADLCLTDAAGAAVADELSVPLLPETGPGTRSTVDPHGEQVAYVLFTSGSTGAPKAVAVPHRALGAHAEAIRTTYRLTADDRVLQFATIGFDVALEEVFPSLLAGAELVLAPSSVLTTEQLNEVIERDRITVANIPTPYWHQWVQDIERRGGVTEGIVPPSLRLLVIGSDMGRANTYAAWRRLSRIDVMNAYGLTETTITSTTHLLTEADARGGATGLPVGMAIQGTEVVVLDQNLDRAPAGVTGEVYIGGAGLALGYRDDPRLSAERFIPDPISGRSGARLYRTGDRGVLDADGILRILGRVDDLVKIRGQRVHPQEVSQHLGTHPEVAVAHVRAEDDGDGAKLVGYVVPADPHSVPTAGTLRAHLAASLPSGHNPSHYIVVDALPLLPNGKIDADALPTSRLWHRADDVPFREPATETESALSALWQDVLRVAQIGVDDSFFELGGHSLAAVQITNRIRARWAVELTVADLMEHSTISALAAVIDSGGHGAVPLPAMDRGTNRDGVPLTAQQQQVWFLNRLSPGNIAYHAQTTMRVAGDLDIEALQRAVDVITVRQGIFRTTFHDDDGVPFQRVHAQGPMPVRLIDLTAVPKSEQRDRVEALTREEMTTPFDLGVLPLVRWTVVRLGQAAHEIILVEHHLVHDGWSFGLLMREFRAAYSAEVAGTPFDLPEVEFQYSDYARWQRRALDGPGMASRRDYWAGVLSDSQAAVSFPTTKVRSGPQSFDGSVIRLEVPTHAVITLRELARRHHTTLFSVMLAAFYATLWRYTRQDDLAIGSAFANRQLAETEDVIGMFVNAVVLRCDAAGDPTFTELLRRSSRTVREATANQEFPFVELVRTLNPDRDPTTNPYFQVMFSANDARMPDLELPGCSATVYERDNGSAKVDVNVVVIPRAEAEPGADGRTDSRITLLWEYNSDLFAPEFMTEVAHSYVRLLELVSELPDTRISAFDLLGSGARERLLRAGSGPAAAPAERFADLFAASVARVPAAPAIRTTRETLNYTQVAEQAAAVARLLDQPDEDDDAPVGVLLQRTPRALVSLLGTLLSGRGYLPLDPAHPAERIAFMLRDSRVRKVIVDVGTAHLLPAGKWDAVDVTTLEPGVDGTFRAPHPAATAWVMYTSGSTGTPKGCRVTHANMDYFLRWAAADSSPDLVERTLASTALTFDVSVHEILPTLVAGGTIVLVDDLFALPSLPAELVPTQVNAVGSLMTELLRDHRIPAGVRSVNLVGEAGTAALVGRLLDVGVPQVRNLYGPTESTVFVTSCAVTSDVERAWPLGFAGPGVEVHVVDPDGNLVPRGVEGELALGGEGVSDGYLGRARLTAERFVPDPFSDRSSARLYLTGDRARWALDGTLEYLGRRDHQVKIRGVRIELGEIEQVLAAHPAVSAAFVQVVGEAPAQALFAYVRSSSDAAPSAEELRAHAAQKLPSAMVPSGFVLLEDIPLTTSGKVDRARLPEPVLIAEPDDAADDRPWTELERALGDIWAQVLAVSGVDRHDNLFVLGGHSLAVLRIRYRIEEVLGVNVPVPVFFECPTVAELAAHMAENGILEEVPA